MSSLYHFRFDLRIALIFLLLPLPLWLLQGCSSGRESVVDRGTTHNFQTGHPEVLARATSFFDDEGHPVVDINLELPHQNLVFRTLEGRRFAEIAIQARFRKRTESGTGDIKEQFRDEKEIVIRSGEGDFSTFYNRRTRLEPGKYTIELVVTDKSSDKSTTSRLEVDVPDPTAAAASITDIAVITLGDGDSRTITSYLVPARRDSLSFEFYVTRRSEDIPVTLNMRLLKFRSDTEPARAMGQLPVTSGNIAYRGIDYREKEEIQKQTRQLDQESGPVLIEFSLPRPENGNYRFEIQLETPDEDGETQTTRRFRDFAMVSPNFPRVQSTREMAEPLVYLMRQRDYRNMMRIEDPDSLRREVDRFWLDDMPPSQAREQIQRYYSRVEDANRMFSNFKEGWKTDMGLVYILLGPPLYIESNIDSMIWHYSYNRMDPRTVIIFERARITSSSWPFRHYVLTRNRFYQSIELEAINNWTSGRVPRLN